jgi:hypothetical protein
MRTKVVTRMMVTERGSPGESRRALSPARSPATRFCRETLWGSSQRPRKKGYYEAHHSDWNLLDRIWYPRSRLSRNGLYDPREGSGHWNFRSDCGKGDDDAAANPVGGLGLVRGVFPGSARKSQVLSQFDAVGWRANKAYQSKLFCNLAGERSLLGPIYVGKWRSVSYFSYLTPSRIP